MKSVKCIDRIITVVWGVLIMLSVVIALKSFADAQPTTLSLKPLVQVSTDQVTLRDVIASGKDAIPSRDLILCPSPDLGTVRMLNAAAISVMLKKEGLDFAFAGARQITILRRGRRISIADLKPLIESALRSSGSEAAIRRIQLQPAILVPPDARLDLMKLKFDPIIGSHRASFAATQGSRRISAFEALITFTAGTAPDELDLSQPRRPDLAPEPILIHRGENAVMQIHGDGFSASLPVRCLEDGVRGKIFRVRDAASQKIYRTRVMENGQLLELSREN